MLLLLSDWDWNQTNCGDYNSWNPCSKLLHIHRQRVPQSLSALCYHRCNHELSLDLCILSWSVLDTETMFLAILHFDFRLQYNLVCHCSIRRSCNLVRVYVIKTYRLYRWVWTFTTWMLEILIVSADTWSDCQGGPNSVFHMRDLEVEQLQKTIVQRI